MHDPLTQVVEWLCLSGTVAPIFAPLPDSSAWILTTHPDSNFERNLSRAANLHASKLQAERDAARAILAKVAERARRRKGDAPPMSPEEEPVVDLERLTRLASSSIHVYDIDETADVPMVAESLSKSRTGTLTVYDRKGYRASKMTSLSRSTRESAFRAGGSLAALVEGQHASYSIRGVGQNGGRLDIEALDKEGGQQCLVVSFMSPRKLQTLASRVMEPDGDEVSPHMLPAVIGQEPAAYHPTEAEILRVLDDTHSRYDRCTPGDQRRPAFTVSRNISFKKEWSRLTPLGNSRRQTGVFASRQLVENLAERALVTSLIYEAARSGTTLDSIVLNEGHVTTMALWVRALHEAATKARNMFEPVVDKRRTETARAMSPAPKPGRPPQSAGKPTTRKGKKMYHQRKALHNEPLTSLAAVHAQVTLLASLQPEGVSFNRLTNANSPERIATPAMLEELVATYPEVYVIVENVKLKNSQRAARAVRMRSLADSDPSAPASPEDLEEDFPEIPLVSRYDFSSEEAVEFYRLLPHTEESAVSISHLAEVMHLEPIDIVSLAEAYAGSQIIGCVPDPSGAEDHRLWLPPMEAPLPARAPSRDPALLDHRLKAINAELDREAQRERPLWHPIWLWRSDEEFIEHLQAPIARPGIVDNYLCVFPGEPRPVGYPQEGGLLFRRPSAQEPQATGWLKERWDAKDELIRVVDAERGTPEPTVSEH